MYFFLSVFHPVKPQNLSFIHQLDLAKCLFLAQFSIHAQMTFLLTFSWYSISFLLIAGFFPPLVAVLVPMRYPLWSDKGGYGTFFLLVFYHLKVSGNQLVQQLAGGQIFGKGLFSELLPQVWIYLCCYLDSSFFLHGIRPLR